MPNDEKHATTAGSQVDTRQADTFLGPDIPPLPLEVQQWLACETLNQARKLAAVACARWEELAASGNCDAESLAAAETAATEATLAVRYFERSQKSESRLLLLSSETPEKSQ